MEAKDFELPIEGSLSKLTLLHTKQDEQPKTSLATAKPERKSVKSLQKNKKYLSKKKK